jgi:hypothetical protein
MVKRTKPGRIAGGVIAILGGISSTILFLFNFNYYNLIFGILGILGGSFLLDDWAFGGGLALCGATLSFLSFLIPYILFVGVERILYILSVVLMALGGFIGLMIDAEAPIINLIDDWIEIKAKEISETYNVIKIEFFNLLWDGLVFEVEFQEHINPKYIKNLIGFLEENWNQKIFLMTKAGLDDSNLSSNKYLIYQIEEWILKITDLELNG